MISVRVVQAAKDRWYLEAEVRAPHEKRKVWNALTDYDHLARYIPNLASSKAVQRGEHLELEQLGQVKFLIFRIKEPVTFNVVQNFEAGTIDQRAVRGKFKKFEQHWTLSGSTGVTFISYRAEVQPSMRLPQWLVKRQIRRSVEESFGALLLELGRRP